MANTNAPFGLAAVRSGGSSTWAAGGNLYSIPAADGSAYYKNDPVKAAASSDANGVANVAKITNGTDAIRGSITGIIPVYAGVSLAGTTAPALGTSNIPATKAGVIYYVLVEDDPYTMYMMQDDGITTANLVAASANLNSTYTVTAGAGVNSESGSVLLSSSFAATNTFNLKLQGLAQIPNNAYGAYAKWNVRINVHELTGSTVGI